MSLTVKISLEEFLALPERTDITELLDGDVTMTPTPTDRHQETAGSFFSYIKSIMPGGTIRFAPTGVQLDDTNFVEPDVFWVRADSDDCILLESGTNSSYISDIVCANTGLSHQKPVILKCSGFTRAGSCW